MPFTCKRGNKWNDRRTAAVLTEDQSLNLTNLKLFNRMGTSSSHLPTVEASPPCPPSHSIWPHGEELGSCSPSCQGLLGFKPDNVACSPHPDIDSRTIACPQIQSKHLARVALRTRLLMTSSIRGPNPEHQPTSARQPWLAAPHSQPLGAPIMCKQGESLATIEYGGKGNESKSRKSAGEVQHLPHLLHAKIYVHLHALVDDKTFTVDTIILLKLSIPRLTAGARGAIRHCGCAREQVSDLVRDLENGSYHVFGQQEKNQISGLLEEVSSLVHHLVAKSPRLIQHKTNNSAEFYMRLVAKYNAGKRINFTQKGSFQLRCCRLRSSYDDADRPAKRCEVSAPPDTDYGRKAEQPEDQLELTSKCKELVNTLKINETKSLKKLLGKKKVSFGTTCDTEGHNVLCESCQTIANCSTAAMEYGRRCEYIAVKQFESQAGSTVTRCGLFISLHHGYLGASSDDLTQEDAVIEVKCILSASLKETVKQKKGFFLELTSDGLKLKKCITTIIETVAPVFLTRKTVQQVNTGKTSNVPNGGTASTTGTDSGTGTNLSDIVSGNPSPTISMVSKHSNGTLNLWQLTFGDQSKFSQLASDITQASHVFASPAQRPPVALVAPAN
ncbi:hypothetical protein PR048_005350 [Dryococelus australis]|uniref:YqaJ viral recombinase domain-containing protein n=1 Tax=Dryococelus australis TaxID=614101 RepID=A0ABQ9I807_9NEOP|nr:hypothetical protein PR048_005350 [Dryococelus australis]